LRLPFYNTLDDASQARVVEGVIGFQPLTLLTASPGC
jgi:hypothetical protein